jgi:hypothetical protein
MDSSRSVGLGNGRVENVHKNEKHVCNKNKKTLPKYIEVVSIKQMKPLTIIILIISSTYSFIGDINDDIS